MLTNFNRNESIFPLVALQKSLLLYPRHEKQLFAGENRILIDDLAKTIDEWNAKGGIGILHTSTANTIKELKKLGL